MALVQITEPGQAIDPHIKKRAAGIDLGTTNSLIASHIAGRVITLADEFDQHILPSVVRYLRDGSIQVGAAALAAAKADPQNTLLSIKRYIGRGIEDVTRLGDQLPYNFDTTASGMPMIKVVSGDVSPVSAAAEILSCLAHRAAATLAGDLDGVVIAVPAYFDESQRQATKDAATIAGLNVLRLLSEPTAAAVAYGLDTKEDGIIAVYDFGGGTFDISLLHLNRGVFEVLATGGDSTLGGDDFDTAIAEWIIRESGFIGQITRVQLRTLLLDARAIKEQLSSVNEASVHVKAENLSFAGVLCREKFAALIKPLLDKSIQACRRAVRDAGLQLEQIDQVVMVGGSTLVPAVLAAVAAYFGREPLNNIDPARVVALGAAAQAHILVGNKADEMLLLDVLPLSLGLETMGGLAEKIIPRNTTIPVTRGQEFTTYKDGQAAMLIHVLQGERELVADCRSLARFELRGIPPMVAGAAKIQVLFRVDADGLLSVSAQEQGTGIKATVVVKPSFGLEESQVTAMLTASFEHAQDDIHSRQLTQAKVTAKGLTDAVRNALAIDGVTLLSTEQRNHLQGEINRLVAVLDSQDVDVITEATQRLGRMSDDFAASRMDASVRSALSGHNLSEFD